MWSRLDDGFTEHPKIMGLTLRQRWLVVEAICYCQRNQTDGELPKNWTRRRSLKSDAEALVHAQLWEKEPNGWRVHDWHEYNPPAAQTKLKRQQAAARTQRWRDRAADRKPDFRVIYSSECDASPSQEA